VKLIKLKAEALKVEFIIHVRPAGYTCNVWFKW